MSDGSVLIVEDEAIVAADLSATVQRLGYDVLETVSSGTTAVTRVAQLKPDLVLMDITLEGEKDGVAAAQTIGARFGIPAIFITAHTDRRTIERARAAGPSGYVVKPFDQDRLGAAMSQALGGADTPPATAAGRATILIVDDMAHTQATLTTVLAQKHLVKQSPSMAHARRMLSAGHFDLIVINIDLPDLQGGQAIRALRREMKVTAPIIAVASQVSPETAAFLKADVSAVLMTSQIESRLDAAVNLALVQ